MELIPTKKEKNNFKKRSLYRYKKTVVIAKKVRSKENRPQEKLNLKIHLWTMPNVKGIKENK